MPSAIWRCSPGGMPPAAWICAALGPGMALPADNPCAEPAWAKTSPRAFCAAGTTALASHSFDSAGFRPAVVRVTDNDGDVEKLKQKYKGYENLANVTISYDEDEQFPTLEPQLARCNDRETLNQILGTEFGSDEELSSFMQDNKTDCALKIFESDQDIVVPEYIAHAIAK